MSTDTQYIVEEILKMADNHLLKISTTQTLILTIVGVPYSPLLSKTYNAHINVEFCSSVKSIKYICKYVHKGSDMAVFRVENTNVNAPPVNKNDEITLYQIGRYISSNEAAWRIFGFPIHERDPAVVQLAIHLENGQRVFFTNETAIDRAINPPKTTLTAF
ncbi:helitron_like_N domain-containing protein [Trichonephila clavipes]|nr:helitron_like_N domain-containing protein [Trichonephila clavipes]